MPRTRVKICCIQSADEARRAVAAGADLLGLVAAMPSGPGPIPDARIAEIAAGVPPGVTSVLLTAETDPAAISALVAACRPGAVQLVDHAAIAAHPLLRADHPSLQILQVVHVEDEGAVGIALAAAATADAILLDSGRPSARELGGTGRVHDWAISREVVRRAPKPVFLAGGLRPGNVADAIRAVRPFGVDLCSGVRTGGALDPEKLAAFMEAVRAA